MSEGNVGAAVERLDALKRDPNLSGTFMAHLGKTVKRDETTKRAVFSTGISAYSQHPMNLFLRGPSSIGKTYNVTQTLKYFPPTGVWMLGGLSPTALVHDYGVFIDPETGEEVDFDEAPKKEDYKNDREGYKQARERWKEKIRRSYYLVNLQNKILVFLESPNIETFNKLRPILSHDVWETSYKFTDKTAKGGLRTMHVVLQGWPATIFCTTDVRYIEDLATRGLTVTPEMEREKYKAAVELGGEKRALPWRFNDDPELKPLRYYIQVLIGRLAIGNRVVIPYARELARAYPATLSRDMRDFEYFQSLIEMSCLLHLFQRPAILLKEIIYFMANMKDCLAALELFKNLEETTRAGIPGHILSFFQHVVLPVSELNEAFRYQDLVNKQNEVGETPLSSKTIHNYVGVLEDIGWMDSEPDPNDKRVKLLRVLKKPENTPYYSLRRSLPFFSLEDFKNWLEEVKNYSLPKRVLLYENYLGEEPRSVDLSLDDDVKNSFIENLFSGEYFLEPLEPKEGFEGEKKEGEVPREEKGIISAFSLDQVASLTRPGPGPYMGLCDMCGDRRTVTWVAEDFKGRKWALCEDCGAKVQEDLEKRGGV